MHDCRCQSNQLANWEGAHQTTAKAISSDERREGDCSARNMFLLILVTLISSVQSCGDHQFLVVDSLTNKLQCCDLCQKGFFMVKPCTSLGVPTQCGPCPSEHFNDQWNNRTQCRRCLPPCSSGKIEIQQCTAINNRICQCPTDTYWNRELFYCQPCRKCKEREREALQCTKDQDRECDPCPKNTYPKREACLPCTHCRAGEVVVKECGAGDTQCAASNVSTLPTEAKTTSDVVVMSITQAITQANTKQPTRGSSTGGVTVKVQTHNKETISVWIWVGLAVLMLLLGLIVGKIVCHHRYKSEEKMRKCSLSRSTEGTDLEENSPEKHVYVTQMDVKKRPDIKIVDKGRLWRDVQGSYTDELGSILNPASPSDWSMLAGKLGYSPIQIANFRLDAKLATQELLLDWGTRNEATVYQLYETLKRMRRDDAADVILPLLKDPLIHTMV